jgi:hypothetical protein
MPRHRLSTASVSAVADDQDLHSIHAVEVTQIVGERSDTLDWPTTEQRLQTPLALMSVAGVQNHVLILVLDAVEFSNHLVMAIVETHQRDHLPGRLFEPGVGFDVLLHRFPDGS